MLACASVAKLTPAWAMPKSKAESCREIERSRRYKRLGARILPHTNA